MRSSTRSEPRRPDAGQAAVELALSLPLVFLVLLGVVQVGLVVRDQLLVDHLAREAARAAAPAAAPVTAARGAVAGEPDGRAGVAVRLTDQQVRVTVTVVNHTDVPLVGLFLPDVTLRGTVTMQREPP
jgi:Flp pilus assembly protein TadG